MIMHRLQFPVGHGEHIGNPRVNPGDRMDFGFGFHDRRMKPRFRRDGALTVNDFSREVDGQQIVLRNQREGDSWS